MFKTEGIGARPYWDSRTVYLQKKKEEIVSPFLVNYIRAIAGKRILDFGCGTGSYCEELARRGFECIGVDVQEEYIRVAKQSSINAVLIKDKLPFVDKFFDTAILVEVLEHIRTEEEIDKILAEVKRVTSKNIIITVPDAEGWHDLYSKAGLIHGHFITIDHVNLFNKHILENVLAKHFTKFSVKRVGPIMPYRLLPKPIFYYAIGLLYKMGILRPKYYSMLLATVELGI